MVKTAVVLLSGGLDSAITTAYLLDHGYMVKAGIFVDRDQSNLENEKIAAEIIARRLDITLLHAHFSLPNLMGLLPKDIVKKSGSVPGRNFILGTLALPYLYALNCDILAIGNVASDRRFSDCSRSFRDAFSAAATQALQKPVSVVAPFADWENAEKKDEILYASNRGHGWIFSRSWTCWYVGVLQCGACDTCRGRMAAFREAGVADQAQFAQEVV